MFVGGNQLGDHGGEKALKNGWTGAGHPQTFHDESVHNHDDPVEVFLRELFPFNRLAPKGTGKNGWSDCTERDAPEIVINALNSLHDSIQRLFTGYWNDDYPCKLGILR